MLPSSKLGALSASCPIGLRESTSAVINPLEWISPGVSQPPVVEEAPPMEKPCTVLVTPSTRVLVVERESDGTPRFSMGGALHEVRISVMIMSTGDVAGRRHPR